MPSKKTPRTKLDELVLSRKIFKLNIKSCNKKCLIPCYVNWHNGARPEGLDLMIGDIVVFQCNDYGNCLEIGEVEDITWMPDSNETGIRVVVLMPHNEMNLIEEKILIQPDTIWCYFEPNDDFDDDIRRLDNTIERSILAD